ncbi:hypothetical protein [Pseudactinotalea sp.]|uniref:hypothetical protein n=1 Tax=Pseudactinotalea sp. TaxID=1926260 RepID=UPI003B3A417C
MIASSTGVVAAPPATLPGFFRAAMAAAPVLLLASTVAFITLGAGINHGLVGGVVTIWSVLAFAVAFVGCARILELRMPRGSRFVTFGAAALAVGGAAFGIDAIYADVLLTDHQIDAAAAVDAHPLSALAYLPWGWFMPITCIVTGALLWRARLLPWWHGLAFALGGVLFVTGRPARIDAVAIITDLVLIAAFWLLAMRPPTGTAPERRAEA